MLLKRYLSDSTGAGAPQGQGQGQEAQKPVQDTGQAPDAEKGTEAPEGGTVGVLSDLEQEQDQPESVDALPDWAQKLIKDLRGENASHRKAKKQAETEAEKATRKAAEEQGKYKELYEAELNKREAAEAKARELELDALKNKVASEVGLPLQLASRLTGETEDEIKADAREMLAVLPKQSLDNDAGRGTGSGSQAPQMSEDDIKEFAARYGVDPKYVDPKNFRLKK